MPNCRLAVNADHYIVATRNQHGARATSEEAEPMADEWTLGHEPRRIAPAAPWLIGDWRLKVYGVCGLGRPLPESTLKAARRIAEANLPTPARAAQRYGLGFVICHEARAFDTITLDWWECVNELRHLVFRAAPGEHAYTNITATGEAACVWELQVIAYERDAWLDCVLRGSKMDFARYNSLALSGMF
jgi:hypothetical protein